MSTRLERSQTNRMVAGVCGGIGDYLQVDATLVRGFFVLLAIAGGIGVLLYIVMLIIMPLPGRAAPIGPAGVPPPPSDPSVTSPLDAIGATDPPPTLARADHERRRGAVGIFLVVVGVLFLLGNLGAFRFVDFRFVWPLVIIAFGVLLLVQRTTRG